MQGSASGSDLRHGHPLPSTSTPNDWGHRPNHGVTPLSQQATSYSFFFSMQAAGNGSHEGAERPASCIDLATIGPLRLLVEAVLTGASASTVTVLLQVLPERSTSQNSEGLSQVEGWPIR